MSMNETTSPQTDTQPRGSNAARYGTAIVRILLGLLFLVFGLNGFLNFIPQPKDMPQDVMTVMGALMKAGYMTVVSGAEVALAGDASVTASGAQSAAPAARTATFWEGNLIGTNS